VKERIIWSDVKCIRQFVLIAVKSAKFPLNLTEADPFTAENAMLREDRKDQIDRIEDTEKNR